MEEDWWLVADGRAEWREKMGLFYEEEVGLFVHFPKILLHSIPFQHNSQVTYQTREWNA